MVSWVSRFGKLTVELSPFRSEPLKQRYCLDFVNYINLMLHEPKVGRNDPCPCGSGRKFKKCHGAREGDEVIGVTANKPKVPKPDRGSAVANLNADNK
jgi:hypothetical protein